MFGILDAHSFMPLCIRRGLTVREGDSVFHVDRSNLGLGRVLEVFPDSAQVRFYDPVSYATRMMICPIMKLRLVKKAAIAHKQKGPLTLRSKRAKWVETGRVKKCALCGQPHTGLWKFTGSSWGEVHLCKGCKAQVVNRTYGSKDGLTGALSSRRWEHKG